MAEGRPSEASLIFFFGLGLQENEGFNRNKKQHFWR